MKPEVIVSTLALVVSTATAIWQIARYLLEGGRIRVRLYPAVKYVLGGGIRYAPNWEDLEGICRYESYFDELAVLEIENIGRTAVTVSDPGLEERAIGWVLRGRRTVMSSDVKNENFEKVTDNTHRIEPLDVTRYLVSGFRYNYRVRNTGPFATMEGSVRVAGKRARQRTTRKNRWLLAQSMPCFVGHNDLRRVAYVALRKVGHHDRAASAVADHIWNEYTPEETDPTRGIIEAIQQEKPTLDWLPSALQESANDRLAEHASFVWNEISRFYFEHPWYKPCGRPIAWVLISWLNKKR